MGHGRGEVMRWAGRFVTKNGCNVDFEDVFERLVDAGTLSPCGELVVREAGARDHPPGDDVFKLLAVVFANAEKLRQVGDKGDELKICNDNPALSVVELFHRFEGSRAFLDSSRGISEHIIDSHSSAHKNPQVLGRFHNPDVVLPFRRKS